MAHLIDREGDSVRHIRQRDAEDCHWLVRVKDNPEVEQVGQALSCKTIADTLTFKKTRKIIYHGKPYQRWVAETPVRLTRPARPCQKKSKKPAVPGEPVEARLAVSRVLSEDGGLLAEWPASRFGQLPPVKAGRLLSCGHF